MKKLLLFSLIAGSLTLAACSNDDTASADKEKETSQSESTQNNQDEKEDGSFYEEGFGQVKVIANGPKEAKKIDMDPMKVELNNIRVVDVELDKEMVEYLNDGRETLRGIIIDVTAENTTEDDITFDPNQAIIVTDTGEQIESDLGLMGDAGGDFLGKVTKEGSTWWFLDNIDKDVKRINVIISAPYDTQTGESIGEEKRIEFEIE
ncbi:hypothetical protein [Cytobacillus kochii]|uniref:hypothetical protein n=1 Tax=Cytobacillus kochii TaxID=859143 RepID=UPI0025A0E7D4|nr:hypothetical protein [Cytobacillus kochii]MDM5208403.1 hypothetical protein [Cytobacillus kochii]